MASKVRIHVIREAVTVVRWLNIGDGETVFVLPADQVTQEGADALAACWAHFVDRGVWVPSASPRHRILARYVVSDRLGPDTPAVVRSRRAVVVGVLSSAHFAAEVLGGLNGAVQDCAAGFDYGRRRRGPVAA